jgi:hypothetical protein
MVRKSIANPLGAEYFELHNTALSIGEFLIYCFLVVLDPKDGNVARLKNTRNINVGRW